jgi:hypothetical protein
MEATNCLLLQQPPGKFEQFLGVMFHREAFSTPLRSLDSQNDDKHGIYTFTQFTHLLGTGTVYDHFQNSFTPDNNV